MAIAVDTRQSRFLKFPKKIISYEKKRFLLLRVWDQMSAPLAHPESGLVVVGGDETLFYDSKSHCGSFA